MSGHRYEVRCREFVERVTDLLEGGLDEGERVKLEQHTVWCEMCADYVEQMRHTTRLLAHVHTPEPVLDHHDAAALAAELLRMAATGGAGA